MRFKPFESISQPPLLRYEDYLAGSDFSIVSSADLLNATAECFQASKAYVDHLTTEINSVADEHRVTDKDELKRLAKIVLGNSIYLLRLRQKIETSSTKENSGKRLVEVDRESHKHFCTIKIS